MSVRALLRGWWIVLLAVLLAVGASLAYTINSPDRYQSRGTYVIGPAADLTQPEIIVRSFDSLQGQGIVPTLVELLSSDSIAAEVGAGIGLDSTQLEDYSVQASVLSSSNTLELAVLGADRQATAELARGVGTRASAVFEDLYSVYQIRELDEPQVAEDRYSPQPLRNAVLAVLLGLTAGVAIAALRARDGSAGSPVDARVDLVPRPLPAVALPAHSPPPGERPPAAPDGSADPQPKAGDRPPAERGEERRADVGDRPTPTLERRTRAERRRRRWWASSRGQVTPAPATPPTAEPRETAPRPAGLVPPGDPAPAVRTAVESNASEPVFTEPVPPGPSVAEPTVVQPPAPEPGGREGLPRAAPVGSPAARNGGSPTGWPAAPPVEVAAERSDDGTR